MKTLKNILESITIEPNSVKNTGAYIEIWWRDLNVQLKKSHQQPIINGYIDMIRRNHWDDSDKKSEIRRWENQPPYIFDSFSAYIKQFGNQEPIISITINGSDPKDKWSSMATVISYIRIPNPDKKEYSSNELIELANAVIDKLNSKTTKVVKYMANNWTLPNEYIDYNTFIKL